MPSFLQPLPDGFGLQIALAPTKHLGAIRQVKQRLLGIRR